MCLIRPLILLTLENNIYFKALHIRGKENRLADSLSRLQFHKFRELCPIADHQPTLIPQMF